MQDASPAGAAAVAAAVFVGSEHNLMHKGRCYYEQLPLKMHQASGCHTQLMVNHHDER